MPQPRRSPRGDEHEAAETMTFKRMTHLRIEWTA